MSRKEELLAELGSDRRRGLTAREAEERLARCGRNELAEHRRQGLLARFLGQMKDPMILVLLAAAALSLWASGGEDWLDAAIILVIVVVNALISISQEDSAEKALEALRPMTPGRIIAVFGCGGCRDKGKRPLMGAAAGQYADLTVLTSDNPRTEDPLAIIRDILPGLSGPHLVIPDRREAIFRALDLARPGDTVILCGKGHEDYQEIQGVKHPFDERVVIAELLKEMGKE